MLLSMSGRSAAFSMIVLFEFRTSTIGQVTGLLCLDTIGRICTEDISCWHT